MIEKRYLRVTEVLSPFSGLDKVDPRVLQNAANRGTRVHKACEAIIDGLGEWDIDDEIIGYVDSFKKWWKGAPHVISMEQRFYCDELMITGQVDLLLGNEDYVFITDIKTPAKHSKTWSLQLSAYAHMARKAGYKIREIHALKLDKYGEYPTIYKEEENMDLFKKCLDVFNYFFRRKDSGVTRTSTI